MSGAVGLLAEITVDQFGSCGLSTPSTVTSTTTSGIRTDSSQKPSRDIMNFSKSDLLRLLGLLEAELQARELVIASLKAERTKLLRPSGSKQRYTIANPYTALGRDLDGNGNSNNSSSSLGDSGGAGEEEGKEDQQSNALDYLEAMVAKHKKAEAEMRQQVEGLKDSHAKMVAELDDEKRKHANDTAQGDDVTYMLEKERERLAQQLDFEKAQQKKLERETKRSQAALVQERKKHLQFAKVILDERKFLLMELGEMKQRMEELEDLMIVKEAQLASAKGCLHKERKRLTKMEAGMEKRLSEFDIEREQLRAKLKREESRTQELREELDTASNCINDLQLALAEAGHTDASNGNQENPTSATNGRDIRGKPLGRVTGSPIPAPNASRIGTPRGIRTPPRYDKSESSSSGSEELCSPLSPVTSIAKPVAGKPKKSGYQPQYGTTGKQADTRSVENDNGKTEVKLSSKQKGSLLYSKGNGKTLSPATSLDRLNRANTSSPPPLRGSKIPSSTGSAARSSLMSPQQNRKGSGEIERPIPRQPITPSPKPTATNLVRPTALSSSPFMKAVDAFKAGPKKTLAGLPGAQQQPSAIPFQSNAKAGSPNVPKAAVSPLVNMAKKPQTFKTPTQPAGSISKTNPPSPSGSITSTGAVPGTQTASKSGIQPPVFTPPVKRTISPRGTPPPVPPNKPTLIPQKTNASSSSCTSTTTITSPATTPLSKSDANKNTPCPLESPPVSVRRSDSLVETRRQFYSNKLGGSQTNPRGGLDNQLLISANNNSNNSNAIDTLAIDTNDDFLYDAGEQLGSSLPNHAQVPPTAQKSTTQVGADMQSVLKCSEAPPISSDHGFYHNTLGPRPEGSAPVIARLPPSTAPSSSPLHLAAVEGDTATICRLIEENHSPSTREDDGSTPVHAAAENGQLDCLELLLDLGGNVNIARLDGVTPLHSAAGQGHAGCLNVLLDRNCNPCTPDSLGWYPLHWAAANGHADCVKILIDCGTPRDCLTKVGWSPLHCAAKYNQTRCLQLLLYHPHPTADTETQPDNSQSAHRVVSCDLLNMADQEGWTAAHVAASTGQKECLEMLCNYGDLNLDTRDKWQRTPSDVAVDACKEFLSSLEGKNVRVLIDLGENTSNQLSNQRENQCYVIGQLIVRPGMTWVTFDRCTASVLCNHSRDLEGCARLKSDTDNESDESSDSSQDLGLSANSIKAYVAGNLQWSPGEDPPTMQPHALFGLNPEVTVHLRGIDDGRLDQLAYETLIPTSILQNYVRLIEQYKSVVFYGPSGTGKSLLVSRLAEYVKNKQQQLNFKSTVNHISLHSKQTQEELTKLLCNNGFFIQTSDIATPKAVPILVLDNLDKSTLPGVLSDLLKGLELRGSQQPIPLSPPQGSGQFNLHPECIVIGTMDKSSSGLDLSIQHCFRWVHLHHDREPVASTLPRYLLRRLISHNGGRLPAAQDPAYQAMKWICNVWQRLNDCFLRLKLKHTVLGPRHFRACPVDSEGPNSVFRWFCLSWNHAIAPQIEDTLRRKNSSNSHNYQRMVSTTLYVLLQRAVFPGCPFAGEEAEDYMSSFRGVNELLAQLSSSKTNSLKRTPRRSKSLDRSKTSNKAALMASKQQSALDLDGHNTDMHRSTRSMIPRRVPKLHDKITSDSNSNPVSSIQPDLIPSSPIEDKDLLESLLQLQGVPVDSTLDQLTQLHENLLLGKKPRAGDGKGKTEVGHQGKGERQMKRPSPEDGSASGTSSSSETSAGRHEKSRKRSKDEDGVWDVWEETV